MSSTKQTRIQIEELLQRGEWAKAHAQLGDLWRAEGKSTTANFVSACYDKLRLHLPLKKFRVVFLRSMTLEPLMPLLTSSALVAGIDLETQMGQFGTYVQEILESKSALYSFNADVVFLAIQTRDLLPEIWEGFTDLSNTQVREVCDAALQQLAMLIRTFRLRSDASLVIHTLEAPQAASGIVDAQVGEGQRAAIERFNAELTKICREHRGVYLLEYDALIARHGRVRWHDESKWLSMRMPFATDSLLPMANEWMKFIHVLSGTTCKALVVDLDNTLWGGVLGEDGISSIQIGREYPGAFYRGVQRAILDLHHRGILIAVCSKNNHDEAIAALQNHPEMLLRPEHFAALRINWRDKAENLRQIAAELNIGIDSIAFLDDNPVERDRVRTAIPEIKVISLSERPQDFAAALRDCPYFERLSISSEERRITQLYHEQQKRAELAQSVGSLEDFYRSLDQEIEIAPVTPQTIARVAQLTQKTNQFNVTTRRHTEQQIAEYATRPDCAVYSVRVKDRFGDNGIVGALITKMTGTNCEIETFLLSCRVIGRTIETAVLKFLVEECRAGGVETLQGWFIPTEKNVPVRDLYSSHKFERVAVQGNATLWSLNLADSEIMHPEWIRLSAASSNWSSEQARA